MNEEKNNSCPTVKNGLDLKIKNKAICKSGQQWYINKIFSSNRKIYQLGIQQQIKKYENVAFENTQVLYNVIPCDHV